MWLEASVFRMGLDVPHYAFRRLLITLAPKKLIRTRRASEGSASEPSLARRVSMCKDAKLSCRGNSPDLRLESSR